MTRPTPEELKEIRRQDSIAPAEDHRMLQPGRDRRALLAEVDALTADLATAKQNDEGKTAALADLTVTLRAVRRERDDARAERDLIRTENGCLQAENTARRTTVETANAEIGRLLSENVTLKAQLAPKENP